MSFPTQASAQTKDGPLTPDVTAPRRELDVRPPSAREAAVFGAVLVVATAAMLWLSDGMVLLTRPLWLDEIHTVLVTRPATPVGVIGHLANGADHGPPLYFITVWALRTLTGALAPVALRVLALLCVWGATVLVFMVLRRRFPFGPAAVGAAVMCANPLVVAHAFEGRFYGMWLLCAALLAWAIPTHGPRRWTLAIAAVLLCLVHWYGVIALAMMTVAALVARWRERGRYIRWLAPASAGVAATALCVPLALGQRNAITLSTWVPEFRWNQLGAFIQAFWFSPLLRVALALIGVAIVAAWSRRRLPELRQRIAPLFEPSIAALVALALFPVVLAALSLAGQPSMLGRYSILAAMGWAPMVALAAHLAGTWPTRALGLLVAWFAFSAVTREVLVKERFVAQTARTLAARDAARALGVPVAFQSMHDVYAAAWAADSRANFGFLALAPEELDLVMPATGRFYQLNKGLQVQRDLVRVHSRRFGFPVVVSRDSLQRLPRFALVVNDETLPRATTVREFGALLFPTHVVERLSPDLALFTRRQAP